MKRNRVAVVDVATHAVVEEYEAPDVPVIGMARSGTHIAWVEKPGDSTVKVAVVRRGTTETVRHDTGSTGNVAVQIVGDWLTYRRYSADAPTTANPSYSLYARPLSGGEPVKLPEHTLSSPAGPGGTQLVRGGTFEHDEGLYQIAPGTDGARPVVTLVASTGEPTALEIVSHTVPTTLDLDQPGAGSLTWNVSRGAYANVEVVHKATGKTATATPNVPTFTEGVHTTRWDGLFDDGITACNGEYTWKLTASPWDRVGPDLVRTGSFKLVRKATSHDCNDNGSSDLLLRNDLVELLVHDSHMDPSHQKPVWTKTAPVRIGTGWNTYDQVLIAPRNIAGSANADIVARDKTGVLWLHQGTGWTVVPPGTGRRLADLQPDHRRRRRERRRPPRPPRHRQGRGPVALQGHRLRRRTVLEGRADRRWLGLLPARQRWATSTARGGRAFWRTATRRCTSPRAPGTGRRPSHPSGSPRTCRPPRTPRRCSKARAGLGRSPHARG
ncbi:hypothetical protein [Streptomyces sp. NPDC004330]|uniref:hypothetical protein n=1 Tax=Streptomyces sp. NPDC004330 TaxID=3364700 RepID=UPI0036983BCB